MVATKASIVSFFRSGVYQTSRSLPLSLSTEGICFSVTVVFVWHQRRWPAGVEFRMLFYEFNQSLALVLLSRGSGVSFVLLVLHWLVMR